MLGQHPPLRSGPALSEPDFGPLSQLCDLRGPDKNRQRIDRRREAARARSPLHNLDLIAGQSGELQPVELFLEGVENIVINLSGASQLMEF
jgi:hypothetical protein